MRIRWGRRLTVAASALSLVSVGCWTAEDGNEPEDCACNALQAFTVSVRIQPTLEVEHDFSIELCRGSDCFRHRVADAFGNGTVLFRVAGAGDSWTAEVRGIWPSQPPLREGEVLTMRVSDAGDGRTLADAELTLTAEPHYPEGCVQTRPLNCTKLTASREAIDFRRACTQSDCDPNSGTVLSLAFDADQLLTEADRSGSARYLAHACRDATCLGLVLLWAPGESKRAGYDTNGKPAGPVAFALMSNSSVPGHTALLAEWDDQLGAPDADTAFSLALYRGTSSIAENLIVERHGTVERVLYEPTGCDPQGLMCERFYRQWDVE